METYRLKSKFVESDKEFVIQTVNDANLGAISSEVYVNGKLAETVMHPHPMEINPEEVLSLLKLTHGDKKKEIETLLQAYRKIMDDGDPSFLYHLGTAMYHKGFFAEAVEALSAAVELDSQHHQAYNFLGMARLELGEVRGAVQAAAQAVQTRSGFADYRNNYGEALLAAGDVDTALEQFDEAIRINLYYGDAYFNLGLALIRKAVNDGAAELKGLIARAMDSFKRASVIFPDYEAALFSNGMRALVAGELQHAWASMNAVRKNKKDRHRHDVAGFYMRFILYPEWVSQQAIDERIRYLERQIKKNPGYVDLYSELGRCYLEQARLMWQKGIQQFKKSLELNPALTGAVETLEEAENEYRTMRATLDSIGPKG